MSPGATSTKAILSLPQLFQLNGVDLAMKKNACRALAILGQ